MAHQNRLQNAHVLVFGGTSGIGYAIANMALSYGAHVTISGSSQPKVDAKVAQLRSLYPDSPAASVTGFAADLSDKENLETNLRDMLDRTTDGGQKKIDHIAFTAGDAMTLPKVETVTVEEILGGFTVRLLAPSITAKLLATEEYMPRSVDSSFTITGGTNTRRPMPGWGFGSVIGAALEGFATGMAVDLAPIRANIVIPGAIRTEWWQGLLDQQSPEAVEGLKKGLTLSGEFGRPEDIAEAYGSIMKDRFATGSMVTSDGGRHLVG